VHTDVDEHTSGLEHPCDLAERWPVLWQIGMDHHGDDGVEDVGSERQTVRITLQHRQSSLGVSEHAG